MERWKGWLMWGVSAVLIIAALWLAHDMYRREMRAPWTRDGLVQADLVLMASPVDGVAEDVHVRSSAEVREGELLFSVRQLDRAGEKGAAGGADSGEEKGAGRLVEVLAPARGWVIETALHKGATLKAGEPLFALAVRDSFRVTGFFRETLLPGIREGAPALVTLMAWPERELRGTVESVGRGIDRDDGELGPELLPRVTPTFDWIRLAQRFPVRVRLDELPPDIDLRVGLTASVQILEKIED